MQTNTVSISNADTIEAAIKSLILDAGISYRVTYCGERTKDDNWKCDGWLFNFSKSPTLKGGKIAEFEYFTGLGHRKPAPMPSDGGKRPRIGTLMHESLEGQRKPVTPPVAGLIHSLVMDDTQGQDFAEWCSNYGYDDDSRKAMATYEQCQQQTRKARELFGRGLLEKFAELVANY